MVFKLENDTTDKATSDDGVAISHSIKTRSLTPAEELEALVFTVRHIWAELKAQAAGTITTKIFKDQATSGTTLSAPSAMSMVKSGYTVTTPRVDGDTERCSSFQIEFSLNTVDQEMEIRAMHYEHDMRGHA